ncbi:MAG: head GIN domain-containing protein [Anaerolineales bacterium]
MKRYIGVPIIMLLVLQLACAVSLPEITTGSGNIVTLEESFTGFSTLDISHAFDVEVQQGEEFSVIIRVDDSFVDELDVGVQDGVLKIGFQEDFNYDFTNSSAEAEITMPELEAIDLSGASRARISGFSSNMPFAADVSGASALRGEIEAGDTMMDVSGAGSVDLSGSGADLQADASGGSTIDLAEFPVINATVVASGASNVTVNVTGTLNADASGASGVTYLGNPTLGAIDISDASSVEAK